MTCAYTLDIISLNTRNYDPHNEAFPWYYSHPWSISVMEL